MIEQALDFLCQQVNNYLQIKLDPAPSDDAIILFNVAHLDDSSSLKTANGSTTSSNALLTLINVEEDRVAKQQQNSFRRETTVQYRNPEVYLNLYVLFSVNLASYTEALKRLSLIIQFFQQQNVFDPVKNPTLDPQILKLVVDMYSMNFEQLNHLWGILGGKYLPSVLYKIRHVTIDEEAVVSESSYIKQIQLDGKLKQPVS